MQPTPLEIIKNMREKNFREEIILEEVEKELKRQSPTEIGQQGAIDMTAQEWFEKGSMFTLDFLSVAEQETIYKIMDLYAQGKTRVAQQQITSLQDRIRELEKENERLRGENELWEQRENDPYWYWPQCDVDGCEGVSCNGGGCWRETGYWSVCPKHSQEFRDGKPQPIMRQSAIDREATRDKDGYLPSKEPDVQASVATEVDSSKKDDKQK